MLFRNQKYFALEDPWSILRKQLVLAYIVSNVNIDKAVCLVLFNVIVGVFGQEMLTGIQH